MEMTYDPLYFSSLPAASASSFNLYGTSDAYLLTVGSAGATTLVLPYDIASLPAGVKAYNLTFDGSTITAIRVYSITADNPVLINAEAGNYIFSTGIDWGTNIDYSPHTSTTNGALTGVYNTSMPFSYVPANAYVLQNGDDGLGFYQVEEANTIKITSFRAYLTAPTTSRSLKIVYADESTDIQEVKNSGREELKSEEYYNLSGQRVSKPTKGLYIVNGKKVAIK
jgi:hypothetical protein